MCNAVVVSGFTGASPAAFIGDSAPFAESPGIRVIGPAALQTYLGGNFPDGIFRLIEDQMCGNWYSPERFRDTIKAIRRLLQEPDPPNPRVTYNTPPPRFDFTDALVRDVLRSCCLVSMTDELLAACIP